MDHPVVATLDPIGACPALSIRCGERSGSDFPMTGSTKTRWTPAHAEAIIVAKGDLDERTAEPNPAGTWPGPNLTLV
jgi:hypothetical protein